MQNGPFTATLHFPEYQNVGVRANAPLPAGGVGDGIPPLQGRGHLEEARTQASTHFSSTMA